MFRHKPDNERRLVWFDREGQEIEQLGDSADYGAFFLSPHGDRAVVTISPDSGGELWILDLTSGSRRRLSPGDRSHGGIWSWDGKQIAYISDLESRWEVLIQRVDEQDNPRVLHSDALFLRATAWSPDGAYLLFDLQTESGSSDIWAVRTDGSEEAFQVIASQADEIAGGISKDGNWIFYTSDASGQQEIYLSRFPEGDTTRQVSSGGAFGRPWWSWARESIEYLSPDDKWISIPAEVRDGRVVLGEPIDPLEGGTFDEFFGGGSWAEEHPDGRFLVLKSETTGRSRLEIIYNWAAALE